MTAQLANGGFKIYPKINSSDSTDSVEIIKNKILEKINERKGDQLGIIETSKKFLNYKEDEYKPLYRNQENVKFVLDAMFGSTNELYGTSYASRFDDKKYQFAGKTGTAQVRRITKEERELDLNINEIPYEERDHALYIAYGPYVNPRYAMSVIVEHAGSGSIAAAPIAKSIFKLLIDRHELREKARLEQFTNT